MAIPVEPKAGLKTSEFWIVVIVLALANVLAVLATAFTSIVALQVAAACAAALVDTCVTIGYMVARTSVKKGSGESGFATPFALLLVTFLALSFLTIFAGCSVDEEWVKADRVVYDIVAPEYKQYVAGDTVLDQKAKDRRTALIAAWEARIVEWETTVGCGKGNGK